MKVPREFCTCTDTKWAAWGDLINSRDYLGNTLFDIDWTGEVVTEVK